MIVDPNQNCDDIYPFNYKEKFNELSYGMLDCDLIKGLRYLKHNILGLVAMVWIE